MPASRQGTVDSLAQQAAEHIDIANMAAQDALASTATSAAVLAAIKSNALATGIQITQGDHAISLNEALSGDVAFLQSPAFVDPVANMISLIEKQVAEVDARLIGFQVLLRYREELQIALSALKPLASHNPADPQVPIWKKAEYVLKASGVPMSAKDLLDALTAMGVQFDGKTPLESLRTTLIRKPEIFRRLDDGKFELVAIRRGPPPPVRHGGMPPPNY